MTTTADAWLDPICPWAWVTSRWLLEVEKERDVAIRYHVLSLSALNEGRKGLEPWYRKWLSTGWGPARVVAAAEAKAGNEVVGPLYNALGERLHTQKARRSRKTYEAALAQVGLPVELAAAADSEEWNQALLDSNKAGLAPVGEDLGTPTIHFPQPDGRVSAFFGPVVAPVPRGAEAGRLWDGIVTLAGIEGFYELKRSRTRPPTVD
ncbi:mycothiol-dependent nitroreductase Rv2466c family protein [Kitasatospora sp. NPDC054939]